VISRTMTWTVARNSESECFSPSPSPRQGRELSSGEGAAHVDSAPTSKSFRTSPSPGLIARLSQRESKVTIQQSRSCKFGFVLLELVAVLVLVAIIAAATMMSLRVPLQNARLERALAALEDADQRARRDAVRSGAAEFVIDGDNRTTQLGERKRSLPLGGGLCIDRFEMGGRSESGRLSVHMTPSGRSETYAIRISTNREDPESRYEWLVVIGATGQYIRANEDSFVEAIVQR